MLAPMKTLTNSGDVTGSLIRIFNTGGSAKKIGNLNSAFEKANGQLAACDFEKQYRNPLQNFLNFSLSSPSYETIYRITGGFLNAATSILKRVSVRIFKICKCVFIEASKNLNFYFCITRHQKI
jgi:hypothetical protein